MAPSDDMFETVRRAAERSVFAGPEQGVEPSSGGLNQARSTLTPSMRAARRRALSRPAPRPSGGAAVGGVAGAIAGSAVQRTVQDMAAQRGWSGGEWDALRDLVQRESGWKPTAANPTSSAYGLFQFLDQTRKNYGITRDSSLSDQINAGLQYISDRYKSPSGALSHWLARKPINGRDVGNWY